MVDFAVGQDIGGFGRLSQAYLAKRQDTRAERESKMRQRLSDIQLKQAEMNLQKLARDKEIKSDLSMLVKNLPEGENRFTASYKYLMEQGEIDYAEKLMKSESEMLDDLKKIDQEAFKDRYNNGLRMVLGGPKIKAVIPKKDLLELDMGGGVVKYARATTDGIEIIEGLPEGAKIKGKGDKNFERAKGIRSEIDKALKDFYDISGAYQRVESVDPTAAGDLALIFNYMKILDPGSVVRESEFQTAEQARAWLSKTEESGVSVPAIVKQSIQKLNTGAKLLPEQRLDFKAQARNLYEGQKRMADVTRQSYIDLASGYGIDPWEVDIRRGAPQKNGSKKQQKNIREMSQSELNDYIDREGDRLEKYYIEEKGMKKEDAENMAYNDIKEMIRGE